MHYRNKQEVNFGPWLTLTERLLNVVDSITLDQDILTYNQVVRFETLSPHTFEAIAFTRFHQMRSVNQSVNV